jgi:hypothetical protein
VQLDEARRLLGVAPAASHAEVRAAFRQAIRRVHPDSGGPAGASAGTAVTALIAAYRTVRAAPASAPAPRVRTGPPEPPTAPTAPSPIAVTGDTISVARPLAEVWPVLLDVAHGLGEVAYVDRSVPVIEVIVEFVDHPVSSMLLSAQARPDGTTAVSCAVEALGGDPAPPGDAVARLVAARLAAYES